jgi:hypothetical protein
MCTGDVGLGVARGAEECTGRADFRVVAVVEQMCGNVAVWCTRERGARWGDAW